MKLTILGIARKELLEAIRYYNEQREGLGYELASEFKNVIFRIIDYP